MIYQILFILISVILISCDNSSNTTTYKIKKPEAFYKKNINSNPQSKLKWTTPNNWIEKPKTEMRLASFNAPFNQNKYADISIVMFPGEAGGIEQNINRWRKQINLGSNSLESIINESLEYENSLGPFRIFKLINDSTEEGILGAIINHSNQSIFIKATTTSKGIKELEYEFILFCKSIYWLN